MGPSFVYRFLLAVAGCALAGLASLGVSRQADAGLLPPPTITNPIVATLAGREVTLNGQHFGLATSAREVRLVSSEGTIVVPASSPFVASWGPTTISMTLPPAARAGSIQVVVDGQSSNSVDLLVYEYSRSSVPGPIGHPLHLEVAGDGRVWINEEFQSQLKALTPGDTPFYQAFAIPQAAGPGIFAAVDASGDTRSRVNILGEDIDVQPDGSIWFTQGGAYLYNGGANWNTSRLVRFDPVNHSFRCYTAARDDAEVTSVVVDAIRGMVWYLEAEPSEGSAVGGFSLGNTPSDCNFDPAGPAGRPPLCSDQQTAGCHVRFPLPAGRGPIQMAQDQNGDLWISDYWSNRLARLDPDTGAVTELPLPQPRVTAGPGAFVGAGPHNLEFDANGNLWLTEEFDATISLVRPSLMASYDCTALDATGRNPCIEEVFVGTTGADGQNIHSLDVGENGLIWFTYNGQTATVLVNDTGANGPDPQIGFIATNHGNTVVLLPPLDGVRANSGIVQDPASGDVWFGEYFERSIGRLQLSGEDGDGVPAASDNCPAAFNPDQANADGNFVDQTPPLGVDDLSWANSDEAGDACDADDDNDGLSDDTEAAFPVAGCGAGLNALDPLHPDSDRDGVVDGVECNAGTNPAAAGSKPTADQCRQLAGATLLSSDADGDRIHDRIEVCGYGTSPVAIDSDGDGRNDQCEVVSLNAQPAVNSLDQLLLAQAVLADLGGPPVWNADLNKDGANNSADQLLLAQILLAGNC